MLTTPKPADMIALRLGISIPEAKKYAQRIQSLCFQAPTLESIATVCAESRTRLTETEVALRASQINGLTHKNVKTIARSNAQTPTRSALKSKETQRKLAETRALTPDELAQLRTIAQLRDISLAQAGELVIRVQRLCAEKPSYRAIAEACNQLAKTTHTDIKLAVKASEISGFSRQNLKSLESYTGDRSQTPTPQETSGISDGYVVGQKEINRRYGNNQNGGLSDFGDWESD